MRLRNIFIRASGGAIPGQAYWQDEEDLRLYDESLGKRILWKWESVFKEFSKLGLGAPTGKILDFGCGAGVVGEALKSSFANWQPSEFHIWDHSPYALQYTQKKLSSLNPVVYDKAKVQSFDWVFVSHVLNELSKEAKVELFKILLEAKSIVLVEPGTPKDFQNLAEIREALRTKFSVIAPCTHSGPCPLLGASRDWCHHFAEVPQLAFQTREWSQLQSELKIDLSSLPYSYLVLSRDKNSSQILETWRLLGTPLLLKASAKILLCNKEGVCELEFFKRDNPELFKKLKKGKVSGLMELKLDPKTGRILDIKI